MIVTHDDFIAAFPEFTDVVKYPLAQFTFWEQQAENQLNGARFGTSFPLAVMLFVAHNIVLSRRAAEGGVTNVGGASGVASSKSVGPVSVSYDTTLTSGQGAGFYNATSYGQRLWGMLRAFGTGPYYVPRTTVATPGFGWRGF